MDRTERQLEGIKKWTNAGGKGTWVWGTGIGKTRGTLTLIQKLIKVNPKLFVLIIVPTDFLKEQWQRQLIEWNMFLNCKVEIINSAIKKEWSCDLLVQDECHQYVSETFKKIFEVVSYKMILCLTGTLERLDGKEILIKKYAPVCDTITLEEASKNGWVANSKEYAVMIDVDLSEYDQWNQEFNKCFSWFDYDFNIAMKCATDYKARIAYAKRSGLVIKDITAIAMSWMNCLRKRKSFIQSHPKKIEIAKKILNARKNKKCIAFAATIKDAELIGCDYVLHSKQSKKKNREVLDHFNAELTGSIGSSKALDVGADIPGLSVGIILSTDSSKIRKTQRVGRTIRFEPGKNAEVFTLLIRGTQDVTWFNNSVNSSYTVINEEQLEQILNGEQLETRQHETLTDKKYRF